MSKQKQNTRKMIETQSPKYDPDEGVQGEYHLSHITNEIGNRRQGSASNMYKSLNAQILKSNFNLRKLQIYSAETMHRVKTFSKIGYLHISAKAKVKN